MSVCKVSFNNAVKEMKSNPENRLAVENYYKYVMELSSMLMNQYKINYQDQEDAVQDLVLFTLQKNLHDKVELSGDPMSYFWTIFKREIWRKQKDTYKRKDNVSKHGIFSNGYTDNNSGETDMLKELGFKLEDFSLMENEEMDKIDIDKLPTVVTSKPRRGRPPKLSAGREAQHWENLFNVLKAKKQMTKEQIIAEIPLDKRRVLKNAGNSAKTILSKIAKRDGYKLTVSNDIFILIGA